MFLRAIPWAAAVLAAGCATIEKGRTQHLTIESMPQGATVLVDGREAGHTPLVLQHSRMHGCRITVRKAGFKDATGFIRTVANRYDSKFFRFGADYATGAMNDLVPSSLRFEMQPAMLPEGMGPDRLVLEADAMRDRGEISFADHRYMVRKIVDFYEGNWHPASDS